MSTPARTPSRWNGLSTEERQRERRQLLIESAFELLANEGSNATTVRAVCARARLNPRYFYESFDDLDALVVALYDHLGEELQVVVSKAVADAEPTREAQVRAVVASTVRFVDEDRRRGRFLYHEALGNEALNRRRIEAGFALAALLAAGSDDVRHQVAASFVVGGFTEVLSAWVDGRIKVGRSRLIDQSTELFLAIGG